MTEPDREELIRQLLKLLDEIEGDADYLTPFVRSRIAPRAKLTEPAARQILSLKGVLNHREIASQFGVATQTIARIHRGQHWVSLS